MRLQTETQQLVFGETTRWMGPHLCLSAPKARGVVTSVLQVKCKRNTISTATTERACVASDMGQGAAQGGKKEAGRSLSEMMPKPSQHPSHPHLRRNVPTSISFLWGFLQASLGRDYNPGQGRG